MVICPFHSLCSILLIMETILCCPKNWLECRYLGCIFPDSVNKAATCPSVSISPNVGVSFPFFLWCFIKKNSHSVIFKVFEERSVILHVQYAIVDWKLWLLTFLLYSQCPKEWVDAISLPRQAEGKEWRRRKKWCNPFFFLVPSLTDTRAWYYRMLFLGDMLGICDSAWWWHSWKTHMKRMIPLGDGRKE